MDDPRNPTPDPPPATGGHYLLEPDFPPFTAPAVFIGIVVACAIALLKGWWP